VIAQAPPPCPSLLLPGRPIEHAFKLPGGGRAVLRDPYGGLVAHQRRSVRFTVKGAGLERVDWQLDGAPVTGNRGGPLSLLVPSSSLQTGEHGLTAHVVLRDGGAVDETIDLRVTDCVPASFTAGASALAVDSGGPGLRGVGFAAGKGVRARIPRGHVAGALALGAAKLTLRAPRRGGVLLRHGSLKVVMRAGRGPFLVITGLPPDTSAVRLTLRGVLRGCGTLRATLAASEGGAAALDDKRC
jgi:hypothetical protein